MLFSKKRIRQMIMPNINECKVYKKKYLSLNEDNIKTSYGQTNNGTADLAQTAKKVKSANPQSNEIEINSVSKEKPEPTIDMGNVSPEKAQEAINGDPALHNIVNKGNAMVKLHTSEDYVPFSKKNLNEFLKKI